jgi:hypothetical protein
MLNELKCSNLPKPELINTGTDYILDCFSNSDMPGAMLIIDYMLSDIEDSMYVAFDSYNYRLLLYWMQEYNELISYFIRFDSLNNVNKDKIKPDDAGLYLDLAWSLPGAAKFMFDSINESALCDEYKEVLILDLHKRAMEVDGGAYELKDYLKRVKKFKKTYPESNLKEYVEKYIMHGNSWD